MSPACLRAFGSFQFRAGWRTRWPIRALGGPWIVKAVESSWIADRPGRIAPRHDRALSADESQYLLDSAK
ncbi:hypothetical protein MLPF_0727 [Mycobacterium lepromatosis]|nr:hypothetical protein MLPF_0727 [Mycobacterium lepromatosis]